MDTSYKLLRFGVSLTLAITVSLITLSCSETGQVPDNSFSYKIEHPAYPPGEGPTVLIDEAHGNFHTMSGRYRPFAELLKQDGYVVKPARGRVTRKLFMGCNIYISSVPTSEDFTSAFSAEEIAFLKLWTGNGGSLLLITDHMPDPPAMAKLAEAFGITLYNGYVLNDDPNESQGPIYFRRSDGTLADHPITNGREGYDERIDSVVSFTGCAFEAQSRLEPVPYALTGEIIECFFPLMTFGPMKTIWMTETPGEFPDDTPQYDVEGMYQGIARDFGRGRIAFLGEAGMFTAQIITATGVKFGMNDPTAVDNPQFVLNVMHWLSREL